MTRDAIDRGVNSETSSLPEELDKDPAIDDPTEANLCWSDEVLVKSEVIILPDEILPSLQCRLCHSTDHLCSPIFNLGGGIEMTEAHFETIYRLSDIMISYEKDHASVVCSYCLLKIEEYTAIREVWQTKNNTAHEGEVPAIKPSTTFPASCMKPPDLKDATTQTTTTPTDQIANNSNSELPEATVPTANCETAPVPGPTFENGTINVDEENSEHTQCTIIDVEEYICAEVGPKRRRSKAALIEEVMQLVKKQYRTKPHNKNRLTR